MMQKLLEALLPTIYALGIGATIGVFALGIKVVIEGIVEKLFKRGK